VRFYPVRFTGGQPVRQQECRASSSLVQSQRRGAAVRVSFEIASSLMKLFPEQAGHRSRRAFVRRGLAR
jgi:hypothetical protein